MLNKQYALLRQLCLLTRVYDSIDNEVLDCTLLSLVTVLKPTF